MKVLIDMNLSPRWAEYLASEGFDAVHWSDVGDPTAEDPVLMGHAARDGAIVLTQDLDFGSILAVTNGDKPSVIQIRAGDLRPAMIGQLVVQTLRSLRTELAEGALVTIDTERVRVTYLPLGRT